MSGIPIILRYLCKNQIRYLASGSKVFKIKLVWSFRTHIEHMLWVFIGRKVQKTLLGSHESTALERPTKYPHISNISTSVHFQQLRSDRVFTVVFSPIGTKFYLDTVSQNRNYGFIREIIFTFLFAHKMMKSRSILMHH